MTPISLSGSNSGSTNPNTMYCQEGYSDRVIRPKHEARVSEVVRLAKYEAMHERSWRNEAGE